MADLSRHWLVRLLKVPPAPSPPSGRPESLEVFRAAKNFYRYLVVQWALKQIGPLLGIGFVLYTGFPFSLIPDKIPDLPAEALEKIPRMFHGLVDLAKKLGIEHILYWGEILAVGVVIAQMPLTFTMVRLNYALRWYMLTDRSLRIREGVGRVREMTLTFANVQNVQIKQGPLQRLLGISDVEVHTAGGGKSDDSQEDAGAASMHVACFRGIDNAEQLRGTILTHIRGIESGAGGDRESEKPDDAVLAARRVLDEARALRRSIGRSA